MNESTAYRDPAARAGRATSDDGRQPVIVVAGGKGGVGKSVVSVMLAKTLSELGLRVLLVEGDQNRGSLHVLLGVKPIGRLEALVEGTAEPADLVTPIIEGLSLIAGDCGAHRLYALGALDRARIHGKLQTLYDQFDVVVVDSAPDLEGIVRACSMGATRIIVVTAAEPAALSDTYAVMKTVHYQVPYLPMDVLVNRVLRAKDGRSTFRRLNIACTRFLEFEPRYLGALPEDDALRKAVGAPGVLITPHESPSVSEFQSIVTEQLGTWGVRHLTRHGEQVRS